MKTNSYRILKLRSGEELIAKIMGEKNNKLIIERPMVFKSSMMTDPFGRTREMTILKNWLLYATHEQTSIPKDFVASYLKPDMDVMKLYSLEKKKVDEQKRESSSKKIHRVDNNESPKKESEINDLVNFMNKIKSEKEKSIMEKIMEDMKNLSEEDLREMALNAEEEERNQQQEDFMNYITMTLFLPPEALMSLVEGGLLEEEDIMEVINGLKNYDVNNKRKDYKNYGTDWKDWSPFPEDYLNDKDVS
jgi:hypothetical protein